MHTIWMALRSFILRSRFFQREFLQGSHEKWCKAKSSFENGIAIVRALEYNIIQVRT